MSTDPYRLIHSKAKRIVWEIAKHIYATTRLSYPSLWIGRGWSPDSTEHNTGRALDVIVSTKVGRRPTATEKLAGDALAAWLVKYAKQLHIRHIIWNKQIYRTRYAASGWTTLPGRNANSSISAWHIDHIHILFENELGVIPNAPVGLSSAPKPAAPPPRPFSIANLWRAIETRRYDGNTTTVQALLRDKDLYKGKIDGIYGRLTIAGYAAWQRQQPERFIDKDADGIPGKLTLSRLLGARYYVI